EFSSNIATDVVCLATNRVYNFSKMIFDVRQYSRRARIAQSSALLTAADESASPLGDESQKEAFPTISGSEAKQDRENIIKTSALDHESPPKVTSLAADEGSMQHKLNELMNLYTFLQRQQTEMASKIAAQELEITSLKARVKLLEDEDGGGADPSGEDATIKGRSLETEDEAGMEKSTERGSNDTKELVNVLTSLDAASILTSGVQMVSVPPAVEVATIEDFVPMASKEERERFKRKGLSFSNSDRETGSRSDNIVGRPHGFIIHWIVISKNIKKVMEVNDVENWQIENSWVSRWIISFIVWNSYASSKKSSIQSTFRISNHSNDLEMELSFVLTQTLVFYSVGWIRRSGVIQYGVSSLNQLQQLSRLT
nr:hypothetical protein [Tanacetum cinerariifolium]